MAENPPLPLADHEPRFERWLVLERLCDELAKGRSVRSVCQDEGMVSRVTLAEWIEKYPRQVGLPIARAKRIGQEQVLDEIVEIADRITEDPASRKVQIWARDLYLQRLDPKRWGDQPANGPTVTVGVNVGVVTPEHLEDIRARKRASIERRKLAETRIPASASFELVDCPGLVISEEPAL